MFVKALKMLGFMKIIIIEFKIKNALISFYCFFVRPILKYGTVIWGPNTTTDFYQVELI